MKYNVLCLQVWAGVLLCLAVAANAVGCQKHEQCPPDAMCVQGLCTTDISLFPTATIEQGGAGVVLQALTSEAIAYSGGFEAEVEANLADDFALMDEIMVGRHRHHGG